MAAKRERGRKISIPVRVAFGESAGEARKPEGSAYVFSDNELLDAKPLDARGNASLEIPASREATQVRVMVGPRLERDAATIAELIRRGAKEHHLRLEPRGGAGPVRFDILPASWLCWLASLCVVRGTLLKRVTSGGLSTELPVCNATVEVYEVDPVYIIIPKIPNNFLKKFRDVLLNPQPLPPHPWPDPLPEPFPGPFPGPLPEPDPGPMRRMIRSTAGAAPAPDADAEFLSGAVARLPELQTAARFGSDQQFRNALILHPEIVRILLCYFRPPTITKQLVATATTDDCGHFETFFFQGCNNHDVPDLYFRATQDFFGFPITIYAPTPIACHTHWDYQCGTEVRLVTYHPWAWTCLPCPPVEADGNWVLFTAIGNHSLNAIFGSSQALQGTTTPTNLGLTGGGNPWGGTLRPRVQFANSLRANLGVQYYQLSWRKQGATQWTPMTGDVARHYAHMVGTQLVLDLYPLGPKTVNGVTNLFEIPPAVPPLGQWAVGDLVTEFQSGIFPTTGAAPGISYDTAGNEIGVDQSGKFEIKLDLFDTNGAPVNIGAKGIAYYVPSVDDLSQTITTVKAVTLGLVQGNSMIITVHVDNNPTYASLDPAMVGFTSDPCCGVLEYGLNDWVTMAWTAKHRNNFATYSFGIVRGATGVISQSGTVGPLPFSLTKSVGFMMTTNVPPGCDPNGCSVAGFAENLHVDALAFDGWGILDQYDSGKAGAFVLKPKP